MLAFFLSLVSSLLVTTLFAQLGTFGSCFEGGCGYVAIFFATPVLTLLSFPFWRNFLKSVSEGTRLLLWTLTVFIGLIPIDMYILIFAMIWMAIRILLACRRLRAKGLPIRTLFLSPIEEK
jgi:hypothetical protein